MQGRWVWYLMRENPTCRRATEPVYRKLLNLCSRVHKSQLLSPGTVIAEALAPGAVLRNKSSHRNEKPSPRTATREYPWLTEKPVSSNKDLAQPTIN